MKIKFLVLIIIVLSGQTYSQDTLAVKLFMSTNDLLNSKVTEDNVLAIVNESGENYLAVRKIIDANTLKKSKPAQTAWAIEFRGEPYFNMKYMDNFIGTDFFVKFDVIGHYSLLWLDQEGFSALERHRKQEYRTAGGAMLMDDATTWAGSWYDQEGNKYKLFFINTKHLSILLPKNVKNAPGYLFNKTILKDILGDKSDDKRVADYTVEEIRKIIKEFND